MQKEEEVKRITDRPHRVVIEQREKLNVTGVKDVDSFNENEVIFITTCGAITIMGEDPAYKPFQSGRRTIDCGR